jgi:phytoene synthase
MDPNRPVNARALESLAAPSGGSLTDAYRFCQQLAKARAGNFYYSFLVLPKPQRLAMCALYAFMRVADDLADEAAPTLVRSQGLMQWQEGFTASLSGEYRHPIFQALLDTVKTFSIPTGYFLTLLEGVRRDLEPQHFATMQELCNYCYQVASVVGLCCVRIWGGDDHRTTPLAESAGYAFQLTNILRDVAADAQAGRVYLPEDLLLKQGCSWEQVLRQHWNQALMEVLQEVGRSARRYYADSAPLKDYLPAAGKAIWGVMQQTYLNLLQKMEKHGFQPVYRPHTSWFDKTRLLFRALPVRLGWRESV